MKCLNCGWEPGQSKGFLALRLSVPLCPTCAGSVDRALNRAEKELKMLFDVYKETVRLQLIGGKFHPQENPDAPADVKTVLEEIVKLRGAGPSK